MFIPSIFADAFLRGFAYAAAPTVLPFIVGFLAISARAKDSEWIERYATKTFGVVVCYSCPIFVAATTYIVAAIYGLKAIVYVDAALLFLFYLYCRYR